MRRCGFTGLLGLTLLAAGGCSSRTDGDSAQFEGAVQGVSDAEPRDALATEFRVATRPPVGDEVREFSLQFEYATSGKLKAAGVDRDAIANESWRTLPGGIVHFSGLYLAPVRAIKAYDAPGALIDLELRRQSGALFRHGDRIVRFDDGLEPSDPRIGGCVTITFDANTHDFVPKLLVTESPADPA